MKVKALNIYPLKSGRAVGLEVADVRPDGFEGDRRFMIVEPDGRFVTQRELQALARVEAHAKGDGLRLSMEGKSVEAAFDPGRRIDVAVWDSSVNAAVADDAANAAVSEWFGRAVMIVHMDGAARRFANPEWAGPDTPMSFADGYQVLVTTTGSLADLNRTLAEKGQEPVGMERFRTNILLDCDDPWAEDLWEAIEVGGVIFDFVKPCARCIMTTQDQTTGERIGGNPIQGLAEKRMSADRRVAGVLFGWNAVPRGEGTVRLGDEARVAGTRTERWPMKRRG
ncbi:MAG: MOSC domain-containing protein [Shinella sp.]|nr:MOSC domain-containing protein [Shinella sp.]